MHNPQNSSQNLTASQEMLQQTQRLLAWSAYEESLREVDQKAVHQFELTVTSLRMALWMTVGIYATQFIVVSVSLFIGLNYAIHSGTGDWVGIAISVISFMLLLILLFRSPIHSINRVVVDLARVQIILQGYTRQINQVDATFKQAFLEKKVEIKNLTTYLGQIQQIIDGNVESLLQFLQGMHSL
jgi:hypothetical protein